MNSKLTVLIASVMVLGLFSEAMALDGYRDRKGLLYGGHFGAGQAKSNEAGAEGRLGYHLGLKIGGGVNDKLMLDAGFDYRSDEKDSVSSTAFALLIGANYFLAGDFYVRGNSGMVTYSTDVTGADDENGLAFGLGLGYEFFANSDLAIGGLAAFQYQTFDSFEVQQMTLNVTATVY